jgi:glutamate N-acetyltransferase/amino-acid N-acetyltransferase
MAALDGVVFSVAKAGIKYQNTRDILLMHFAENTRVAGVFTSSKAPSAPVDWCKAHIALGKSRALLVNSGNANAFTGALGAEATAQSAKSVADALGLDDAQVLLASTGVIGEPLDAAKIIAVMPDLSTNLGRASWHEAAQAIMTTDTFAKLANQKITLDGGCDITLNGIAKGSGMIAPDMATMLGFIVTDAVISADCLQQILQRANQRSFNSITVDGDTSTSDTALLFATAKVDMAEITEITDPRAQAFEAALSTLMIELAQLIVKDGEGAQKLMIITVSGAENDEAARRIGLSIANSPLVKTAVAGADANWGRVVMAVGKSGERVDRDLLSIKIGGVLIASEGQRVADYDEAPVAAHMQGRDILIEADIGVGSGCWTVYSCDLTHGYITINAEYRS